MKRRATWLALACALALTGASCAGDAPARTAGNITVLAAASLTEAFTEMGEAFEAANTGVMVTFSFGASSTLATQANEGAPADVFASADEASMQKVTGAGHARDPAPFARNRLAIVVGPGNPKGIGALADLARPDVAFVLCAEAVPCGRFGRLALDRAGVVATPRSYEENVKAVVSKVTLGEADAGIVYVTDVGAAGDGARAVDIPDEHNIDAVYPLAVLEQAPRAEVAGRFKAFVLSAAGQRILRRYGFLPPS